MSLVEKLATNPWFIVASGVASLIGMFVTLYGLRVRQVHGSLQRRLEWLRTSVVSTCFGLLVATALPFYLQDPPPSFQPLRSIHAFLHGTTPTWTIGERPLNLTYQRRHRERDPDPAQAVAGAVSPGPPGGAGTRARPVQIHRLETVTFTRLTITADASVVDWRVQRDEPTPAGDRTLLRRHFLWVATADGETWVPTAATLTMDPTGTTATIRTILPSLSGQSATVYIGTQEGEWDPLTVPFELGPDARPGSHPLWGLSSVVAFVGVTMGVLFSPSAFVRGRLQRQLLQLQLLEYRATADLLAGRPVEQLDLEERRRYDAIVKEYEPQRLRVGASLATLFSREYAQLTARSELGD